MAKLPQYQQSVTRRATQAKQTATDNNMAQAVGQFSQGMSQLASVQNQMQQREARDYVMANQNKTSVGLAQEKFNVSQTATTGSEYTGGVKTYIETQKAAAIESAPNQKAADATGKFYDNLMAQELERSIPVAAKMNAANTARIQSESLQLGFNSTLQDPSSYESNLDNGTLVIESSDLPDSSKASAVKQYDNELSYYRFKGQIKNDPSKALKELESGEWNSRLEPNQLEALTREAANQVKSVKSVNTKKLTSEISDYVAYKSAGGEKVTPYEKNVLVAVYGEEDGASIFEDIQSADKFASDYNKVALADGEDLNGLLGNQSVSGPDNFRRESGQHSSMAAAVQKRNEDLVKDSALYSLKSQNVKASFTNYLSTGDGKSFAETTIAEQTRLGVPTGYESILPKKQASAMVAQYQEGGEDAAAFVNQLQTQFGDYYPKVLQELTSAGLSPNASVVAILPQGSRASTLLAQADKEGYSVIKANISSDDYSAISESIDAELSEFMVSTYSEGTKAQIKGSTELLAMKYLSSGVYPDAGSSIEAAANDIVNTRYSFTGDYRIPIERNQSNVEDGVSDAIDSLQDMDLMPPYSGLPSSVAESVYKLNMKAKAQTLNDDSGVVMVDFQNQPILNANGEMIRFTWDELSKEGLFWKPGVRNDK